MRVTLLLLTTLAVPVALAQGSELPSTDVQEERLDAAAMESTDAPAGSPTLAGANGALLFAAFGASLGAVIALGRYHKKRRV